VVVRKKILILAFSDISSDPRVMRQITWLKNECQLYVAGFGLFFDESVYFIKMSDGGSAFSKFYSFIRGCVVRFPGAQSIWRRMKGLLSARWPFMLSSSLRTASPEKIETGYLYYFLSKFRASWFESAGVVNNYDLIIANDLDCLVFARVMFPLLPVVFDAHEYGPLEYDYDADWWVKREKPAREWACREFLPQVSGMSTVCDGIASEFKRNFSVNVQINVITNAPSYHELPICSVGERIKIVHHGLGSPLRKIECMIEAAKLLGEKYELYLILVDGDRNYIDGLRDQYNCCGNIHFLDPVPMLDIVKYISKFDIGMFILESKIFNYKFALPNKFFEFIQARLALAVGPSPEMSLLAILLPRQWRTPCPVCLLVKLISTKETQAGVRTFIVRKEIGKL
jgi:glycosyltransferase involved in cell wall biosynthesis